MRLESHPELLGAPSSSSGALAALHFEPQGLGRTGSPGRSPISKAATDPYPGPALSDPGASSRVEGAWRPPHRVDKYRIDRFIGRGAMGQVYLAHDTALDRAVAVKFICGIDPAPLAKDRFIVEARAAARLQHPNVVTIYSVEEFEGRPYIVAEYVEGKRLDEIPKPADGTRVIELGIGLAGGLAAAHRKGVLHRDIKPSNAIVADDGEVKLLDFGLAKLLDGSAAPLARSPVAPPPAAVPSEPPRSIPLMPPSSVRGRGTTLRSHRVDLASVSPLSASCDARPRALTDAGALLGTPNYMAPEVWAGDEGTSRSDVYSLGVVLFELCAGHLPHKDAPECSLSQIVQHRDAPLLTELQPTVNAKLAAVIARCLRRNPLERFASGAELLAAMKQLGRADAFPEGNPYRGIHPFEAEHRSLFHGRRAESRAVLDRLRVESVLLVAGDSGVGKSSLCRAGVLPAVQEGAFGDDRAWSVVSLVPGRSPLPSLAAALAPLLAMDQGAVMDELRARPGALAWALSQRLGRTAGIVLFVDQLEELVTMSDLEGAALVAAALGHLAGGMPCVRLLMSVRSDYLARIATLPGLGDVITRALYLLKPLAPEGVRQAILGPAQAAGITFDPEAVDTLVASTSAEGGLPLLQFALAELWEARDHAAGTISVEALARIGGVAGALTRHADEVLLGMKATERREARRILTLLVSPQGAPARRPEDELVAGDPVARAALSRLVAGRLLVAREAEQSAIYELAHDALLKSWETLRRWLDEQADGRVARQRLATATAAWERRGRAQEALWSARQLDGDFALVDPDDLLPRELAFVAASHDRVWEAKIARRIGLVVLLVVGVIAATLGWWNGGHTPDPRVAALVEEARGALTAARRDDEARIEDETDDDYARASRALESALLLDAGNTEARALLCDALYGRAQLAEREHHLRQRDELLRRVALYDPGGVRRRAPVQR